MSKNRRKKNLAYKKLKLQKLQKEYMHIKSKIKKQKKENIKNTCIKNLKIFGNTCNFIMPFVIVSGISVGGFKLYDGGFPFIKDDITKQKKYTLEYKTNDVIKANEIYEKNAWYNDPLPENKLTLYSTWSSNIDGTYSRTIRNYDIGILNTNNLYNAILNKDVDYITNTFNNYDEEKETIDFIPNENEYIIEADLHFFDKNDTLKCSESDLKNLIITLIEIIISISIGSIIAYKRDFNLVYEIKYNNNKYKTVSIKPLKKELKSINKKILSLEKELKK